MSCDKNSKHNQRAIPVTVLVLAVTFFALAIPAATVFADPPGRVARISFTSGSVSFRPASVDEWAAASVNYPLTIGDHIWTDRDARSELQIGSTTIRVAPYTEFSVLNLDDRSAQLRVTEGAVSVRVRNLTVNDVIEIDTPNGAVSVLQSGLYRVDVAETGDSSTITVRNGQADVIAGSSIMLVQANQSAVLSGFDAPQMTMQAPASIDGFEDWCLARDRRIDNVQSVRYVSPEMIGYEDLDAYGNWQSASEYGPVWVPRVQAGWAPYHYGRWVWVDPWGWTWIDEAPWGFAPFHYGRWAFLPARGWVWVPGTVVARPVYAPALVAFVGGSTWSASFQVGAAPVAWFPLGPREVFVPAYHVTPVYVQRVNVAHVTNINVTNINVTNVTYVNQSVPGAVTAVPRDAFVSARPVAQAAVTVSRQQMQVASVIGTAAPVAPERVSVVGQVQARVPVPPAAVVNRQVVVRSAPPPPPVPLAAKQAALAQHPGQPVDAETENALRATGAPNVSMHPLVRAVAAPRVPGANRPASAAPAGTVTAGTAPAPVVQSPPPAPVKPAPIAPPPPPPPPRPAAPAARPAPSAVPAPAAAIAARQAQERTDLNARHAQERAALQAQHDQEQRAADARQKAQIKQRQQEDMKALQDRQQKEREAIQKKQQDERKR